MRPANIVTSVADVLAGVAISGFLANEPHHVSEIIPILLLCFATAGLYGGGVVFNDVFDAELDKVERPERPIPSGLVNKRTASMLGACLLCLGVILAFLVSTTSGQLAVFITASALVYDKWGKHQSFLGPLNMGLCRGLNLLLGISILSTQFGNEVYNWWFLAIIPIIYIASITMISRGEVHGGKKTTLYAAFMLYALVIILILYFAITKGTVVYTLLFLVPFTWMIYKPLLKAIQQPIGKNIGMAVKAGVIALILMNAAWAAAFGTLFLALVIVILLPISLKLAKMFAVT